MKLPSPWCDLATMDAETAERVLFRLFVLLCAGAQAQGVM